MLNKLIEWSLAHRGGVLGASLVVMAFGTWTAFRLPVEVLPDLTKPTVVILTEAPGLAPEDVETRVTRPLESALLGVAGLTRLRSNSDVALSLIYAEFDWNTDIYKNRVLVQERLQTVREQLPDGVQPFMTPVASLMGEILLVGVRSIIPEGQAGYLPQVEVRTIADWVIKRRLQSIPGIAEVLNMGGGIRRLEVRPDPHRLQAHGVGYEELQEAIAAAASTTTGGFLTSGPAETMVRNLAMTTEPGAIGNTAIKQAGDRPVRISDVADVVWGVEPMRGDATVSQTPEKVPTYGVIMSVTKSPGFDTRELTRQVEVALAELQPGLPRGIETTLLFQQKEFIDNAIGNLKKAIVEAAVMVAVVLFLFLLNFRTTFITLMAIPMSFSITMLTFAWLGISVNSMTLGGLAVAIGMVVDDAIVDVENVYRRLREWWASRDGGSAKATGVVNPIVCHPETRSALPVIAKASGEVRGSIFYATVLIVLVFVPLLGLSGVEGKLFTPIAVATIVSMVASFVVSLTLIPVLCSFLLKPSAGSHSADGRLVRGMKGLLRITALRLARDHPAPVLLVLLAVVFGAFSVYPQMGKDFLPAFQEETVLIAATSAPGTSLEEMNRLSDAIEEQILFVPEVRKVGRRLGRAERGDHVVPVSTAEFDVDFRNSPGGGCGRSREEILNDLRTRVRTVPGIFAVVSGPLADRIGHMLSGVSAPVAVKVFGPDLEKLRTIGTEIQKIAQTIPGLENARLDQQSLIPQLRIEADRERAAAYGIAPGRLNEWLSSLIGGRELAGIRDGEREMGLVMRLPPEWRDSPEQISSLPVQAGPSLWIPLSAVADVREAKGPNLILRENSQRRFTVAIKPTTRNVGALVDRLRSEVAARVKLPEGYFVTFEGEFQAQQEATVRIAVMSAGVFVVVAILLAGCFQSLWLALQVLLNIPLALVGGLVLTWLLVDNISIATLIGFIAVGGIAARNGIMMLSHYLHLMRHEGEGFTWKMVERGTLERMVPVMMTALAAGIALIPFVLAAGQPGKEILHPVAVVIVGGLVSSTLLDFLITPLIFFHYGKNAALRALERGAAASQ
ncbi:MAG: efflux RND transporter permease subunit [Terrimicrobiaceae bacterium]